MNSSIQRSTDKERKWSIWVGSMEEIRRLATIVGQLAEIRRKNLLEVIETETEENLKTLESGNDEAEAAKSRIEDRKQERRLRVEEDFKLTATAVDGDDTTSGEVETVLAEMDRRTVQSLKFSAGRYGDQVTVNLGRASYSLFSECGSQLKVVSSDRGWANQAFAQLSDEISKGQPSYSWIRKRMGRVFVGFGFGALPVLTIGLIILPAVASANRWIVWLVGALVAYALVSACIIWDLPNDWLAPRFEIIGEEGQSTGRRRIGTVVGLVTAVIVGIIVNRIYP